MIKKGGEGSRAGGSLRRTSVYALVEFLVHVHVADDEMQQTWEV